MPEVNVVALIPVQPEHLNAVREAMGRLAAESRKEEGCVSYEVYTSAATPETIVTVERWRSQEDLDGHFTTPHIAEAMGVAQGRLAGELTIHPLLPLP